MPITKDALKSIQKTGAFAHKAKLALQETTKKYSERLSEALKTNPYDFGVSPKDLETGKEMRALAQRIHSVEVELVDIFAIATALSKGELKKVLSKAEVAVAAAVDKLVPTKKLTKPVVKRAARKVVNVKLKTGGNKEKLFAALQKSLRSDAYSKVNQAELSKKTGIPLGSMTAAIRSLTQASRIVAGPNGEYKLGKAEATVAAVKAVAPEKRRPVVVMSDVEKASVRTARRKPAAKKAEISALARAVAKVAKKVPVKKSKPQKAETTVKLKVDPTTDTSVSETEIAVTIPGN